eukprot:scaffold110_cov315-Pavlova_lutheri.AAC.31
MQAAHDTTDPGRVASASPDATEGSNPTIGGGFPVKPSNWPIDEFPSKPGRSEDGSGRKISMVIAIVRGTDIDRYRYLDAPIDRLSPGSDDLLSTNHGRMRSLVEIDEMEGEPRIFGDPPICPTESGDGQKFSHIRWVWSRHGSGIRGSQIPWQRDDADSTSPPQLGCRRRDLVTASNRGESLDRESVRRWDDRPEVWYRHRPHTNDTVDFPSSWRTSGSGQDKVISSGRLPSVDWSPAIMVAWPFLAAPESSSSCLFTGLSLGDLGWDAHHLLVISCHSFPSCAGVFSTSSIG